MKILSRKTINEGNVDIQKFPASKVRNWPKRWKAQKLWLNIFDRCRGNTSSPGTINASPTYPTSHWNFPGGNRSQHLARNHKSARHRMFPRHGRHPTCCNWKLTPKSATGAVTHHMQKASNVKPEGSSVKYAINLATSHQYASKKAKANTLLIPFMQGNRKHNNYVWGHFTPSKMQGAVNMTQTQKRTSAYK